MGKLYAWFWYHTEFWIRDKTLRRPYTYIMRDFYHKSPILTIFIIAWSIYIFNLFIEVDWKIWLFISIGVLLGHLFWGTKWIEEEQETPEYTDGNEKEVK